MADYLKKQGRSFVILDGGERIGDSWRSRWDSLRLFTPAKYDGLPGWRFPASGWSFPTKDEMGDYLEAYTERFELPIRLGTAVEVLTQEDGRFVAETGGSRIVAETVVVASGAHRIPKSGLCVAARRASSSCTPVPEPVPAPRRRRWSSAWATRAPRSRSRRPGRTTCGCRGFRRERFPFGTAGPARECSSPCCGSPVAR